MAITALHTAATGLTALNTQLDVTANNLANSQTVGFRASRTNFQDLLYQEKMQPGVENAIRDNRPMGLYVGLGTKVSGSQLSFEQGNMITTGNPYDVAIEGQGFLQVRVAPDRAPNGVAFTRAGQLNKNRDGELVLGTETGPRIEPGITIPQDAISIAISTDGQVSVLQPGATEPTVIGQLQLAVFVNPVGLKQLGENLFAETGASGPPIVGNPNEENRGQLRGGMLEGSNVDPTSELIDLIKTQRAFEMNSQTIRTADESLRVISQLRR